MSDGELAIIWALVSVAGFVAAGLGLIEGLYIGLAALVALGLAFVLPAWLSLAIFAALLLVAIPTTRAMIRRTRYDGSAPASGAGALVGRTGVVTAPITDTKSAGRIRVDGEHFPATVTFEQYAPVHLGSRVLVDRLDGSTLVVTPASALRERYARGEISYDELERLLEEDVG